VEQQTVSFDPVVMGRGCFAGLCLRVGETVKTKLVLVLSVIVAVIGLGLLTVVSVFSGAVGDFTQCANDNINGVAPGPCDFIGSNSQNQKAQWSDNMAVPQRILFQNIGSTTGDVHVATFQWQWSKSTSDPNNLYKVAHSYDYLVSWNQAKQLSYLNRGLTMTIGYDPAGGDDPCENLTGATRTDCRTMHSLDGGTGYSSSWTLSDTDNFSSIACDPSPCVAGTRAAAMTSIFGSRTISIFSLAPITITAYSEAHTDQGGVTVVNTETDNGGTTYVTAIMTYTSSSASVIIETAPHIGVGCSPNIPSSISWGCYNGGASVFSGSPYHFQNPHIDGSTGSMDNQIQVSNFPPTAQMSTQLSATSRNYFETVTDTLKITGTATISGTVRFYVCGPSASPKACLASDPTNTALGTGPISVNPTNSTATSFTIDSPGFTVTSGVGYYCFRVDYVSANTTNQSASDWSTTGECVYYSTPTAVTLTSFSAREDSASSPGRIRLSWETGNELNTAGFHVYRSEQAQGPYARINPQLIPASGDVAGGGKYYFDDSDIVPGRTYFYQLEEVELNGASVRHQAFSVVARAGSAGGVDGRWLLAALAGGVLVAGVVGRRLMV
jgi:hypothetical protein